MGRGVFPYQFSWILELPLRRLILSPQSLVVRLALRAEVSVLKIGPGSGYYSDEVAKRLQAGRLEASLMMIAVTRQAFIWGYLLHQPGRSL